MAVEKGIKSVDYGIICKPEDESQLVKNINAFLKKLNYRKMYKRVDTSIQPKERTFNFPYYYSQFIKEEPFWYFELQFNKDLNGKFRFPKHDEVGMTLYTNKDQIRATDPKSSDNADSFFSDLLSNLGFQYIVLFKYKGNEEYRW